MKKSLGLVLVMAVLTAICPAARSQPAPTGYTLDDVYYYLVKGLEATWGSHDLEPPADAVPGVISGKTLDEIYQDLAVLFGQAAAGPGDVIEGVTFWSTDTAAWGVQTGTYEATGGGLLQTGQTEITRIGDDGYYQMGVAFSYQTLDPADNGEIVTIDNVTGLMWASDGSAAGCNNGDRLTWEQAIDWAEGLTFAGYSDWRLPNRRELESIVDSSRTGPSINTTYFPNTPWGIYWSGSTYAGGTAGAWVVNFITGSMNYSDAVSFWVRAVRGGE